MCDTRKLSNHCTSIIYILNTTDHHITRSARKQQHVPWPSPKILVPCKLVLAVDQVAINVTSLHHLRAVKLPLGQLPMQGGSRLAVDRLWHGGGGGSAVQRTGHSQSSAHHSHHKQVRKGASATRGPGWAWPAVHCIVMRVAFDNTKQKHIRCKVKVSSTATRLEVYYIPHTMTHHYHNTMTHHYHTTMTHH